MHTLSSPRLLAVSALGMALGLLGCPNHPTATDAGVPQCVPGTAAACSCVSGATGAQLCGLDGTFGPCVCGGDSGSSQDGAPLSCAPGTSARCACPGGELGAQACLPSGAYGPCQCGGVSDAGAADSGGINVPCQTNSDCVNAIGPFCDLDAGHCVSCRTAADCPYDHPGCSDGFCGVCRTDADCPGTLTCDPQYAYCVCAGTPDCQFDAPVCVARPDAGASFCGCNSSADCGAGFACDRQDSTFGACVASCLTDAGACDPGSSSPWCDPTTGVCLECRADSDCVDAGLGSICSPGQGCVGCLNDTDCQTADAGQFCAGGACVNCRSWQDCPQANPGCNFNSGQCGSCVDRIDCPPGTGCLASACVPTCDVSVNDGGGTCAPCQMPTDCPATEFCNDAGACD